MRKFSIGSIVFMMVLAMVTGPFSSCSGEKEFEYDDLVFVNDEPIKLQELKLAWVMMTEEQKQDYKGPDGILKLLDELTTYKLMAQEAKRRKLDEDPIFEKKLKAYRESMLVKALIDTAIDDTEVMQEFEKNFIRAKFIYISFPEDADQAQKNDSKKLALEALALVESGTDFGTVARQYSEDYSSQYGGDTGYITHDTMKNMGGFAVAEVLYSLKEKGDISKPVEGKNGYYLFELLEPPGKLDPRGLSPEIKKSLRAGREVEVIRSFSNELNSRKDNKIIKNEEALRDVLQQIADEMKRREKDQEILDKKTNNATGENPEPDK